MRQWIGSELVQIMASDLFSTNPLSKPMLSSYPLGTRPLGKNFSEILVKNHTISFKKMLLRMFSANWWPFCRGGYEIMCLRECHLGVCFQSCEATKKINTKITLKWVCKHFAQNSTHIIYFPANHNVTIHEDKKMCTSSTPCLIHSLFWSYLWVYLNTCNWKPEVEHTIFR